MSNVINFNSYEQQPLLSVGTSSSSGSFTTSVAQAALDVMIMNYGSNGAQVLLSSAASPVAVNTSGAAGTSQYYIPPGAVLVVAKNGAKNFAAITDSSTTNLVFHAGSGS